MRILHYQPAESGVHLEGGGRARILHSGMLLLFLLSMNHIHQAFAKDQAGLVPDNKSTQSLANRKIDKGCFIGAPQALVSTSAMLIDVRVGADNSPVWIPGAVRASPAAATALNSNSGADIFWIGSGKDDADLARECQRLPAAAREHSKVVEGGLPAWYRAHGKVLGSVGILEQPLQLEPSELDGLLKDANPLIVEIGAGRLQADVAAAKRVRLKASVTPAQGIARLKGRLNDVPVVFVVADSEVAKAWWHGVRDVLAHEPFFMIDDGERYSAYIRQRDVIAANANKPLALRCDRN